MHNTNLISNRLAYSGNNRKLYPVSAKPLAIDSSAKTDESPPKIIPDKGLSKKYIVEDSRFFVLFCSLHCGWSKHLWRCVRTETFYHNTIAFIQNATQARLTRVSIFQPALQTPHWQRAYHEPTRSAKHSFPKRPSIFHIKYEQQAIIAHIFMKRTQALPVNEKRWFDSIYFAKGRTLVRAFRPPPFRPLLPALDYESCGLSPSRFS